MVIITTLWWSNESIAILTRDYALWLTSAALSALPWSASYSYFMPGTHVQFLARIYHVAWLPFGREFNYPIDYTTNAHWNLTASMPKTIKLYTGQLTACLDLCCKIAHLLVHEHCALHRKLVNSHCPESHIFAVGNIVFASCAVQSDSAKECVDKLTYACTGPWHVAAALNGGSYALIHCNNDNWIQKKHASNLSPYPLQLLPLQHINGSNTQ